MKVSTTSGWLGKAKIFYEYDDNNVPFGTRITLELNNDKETKEKDITLEGEVKVQAPDQFSRKQGRKWALTSLFLRDKEEGQLLSKQDKRELFEQICPYFMPKAKILEDEINEINEDNNYWQNYGLNDVYIEQEDKKYKYQNRIDWEKSFRFSIIFNSIVWGIVVLIYWLLT